VAALRRGHHAFLFVALPTWFMLALNAAVAVNQVRYNLMLIPPYALAGAMLACAAWDRGATLWSARRDASGGPLPRCANTL